MAYPKKEIDLRLLQKVGSLHCTLEETAGFFDVSARTIDNRLKATKTYNFEGEELTFREIFERGRCKGRVSLRRWQFEAAEKGNPALLIWLGKQLLGQRDNHDVMFGSDGTATATGVIVNFVGVDPKPANDNG